MPGADPWDEWRRRRNAGFFGEFFPREIEAEFERMRAEMERMMNELMKGAPMPKPGEPFVYGFSMHVGPDGKPQVQPFGNAQPFTPQSQEGVRAPLVDIQVGEKAVSVTAELPGVEKADINLHVAEDKLTLRVDAGRRYYKEIPLSARVIPKSAQATFKNGVLDVQLERERKGGDEGERVTIR